MPGRVWVAGEDKPRSLPFFLSNKTKIILHETIYWIFMNTAQYGTSKVLEISRDSVRLVQAFVWTENFPIIIFLLWWFSGRREKMAEFWNDFQYLKVSFMASQKRGKARQCSHRFFNLFLNKYKHLEQIQQFVLRIFYASKHCRNVLFTANPNCI